MHDGETRRLDDSGAPDIRFMIFPTADVEIIDNWHVAGLRGTGGSNFQVSDLFVPDERSLSAFAPTLIQPATLYAIPDLCCPAALRQPGDRPSSN